MAVGIYKLPICDGCKLPWLPVGWTQDSDPRNLPEGSKPLRCGKCKSSNWDKEHKNNPQSSVDDFQSKISTRLSDMVAGDDENAAEAALIVAKACEIPISTPVAPPRCRHRLTHCPICHVEAAQDA